MYCVRFYKIAFKTPSLYKAHTELIKAKNPLKIKETAYHFSKTSCDLTPLIEGLLYKECGTNKKKPLEHILELVSFPVEIIREVTEQFSRFSSKKSISDLFEED